jgi:hypothetical protein
VHTEAGVGTITLLDTLIGDGKDAQWQWVAETSSFSVFFHLHLFSLYLIVSVEPKSSESAIVTSICPTPYWHEQHDQTNSVAVPWAATPRKISSLLLILPRINAKVEFYVNKNSSSRILSSETMISKFQTWKTLKLKWSFQFPTLSRSVQ